MRRHGVSTLEELQRRSTGEPEWYWDAVVRDLGVRFARPYARVLDASRGPAWPRWFPEGLLNLADNCLDRNVEAGRAGEIAIVAEGDDGAVRSLRYGELAREVARLANALARLGVGRGDRVGIFLPMSPETAIALLAAARLGAVNVPCFSGFGRGVARGAARLRASARHRRRVPPPRPARALGPPTRPPPRPVDRASSCGGGSGANCRGRAAVGRIVAPESNACPAPSRRTTRSSSCTPRGPPDGRRGRCCRRVASS
jgi:hypothetical protein